MRKNTDMKKNLTTREILATNLRALMLKHGHSEGDLFKKSKVAQSTINRTLKCQTAITTDKLEAIASVYNLWPWQLLIPNLDTNNPQMLKVLSKEEQLFYEKMKALIQNIPKQ